MAFPTRVGSAISANASTSDNSNSVNMPPTVGAGELLLILHSSFSQSGGDAINTPSGWTLIQDGYNASARGRGILFAKEAVGTEGGTTVTITRTNGRSWCAKTLSISGWDDSGSVTDAVKSAITTYTTNSLYFTGPNLTPGWTLDTLWITAYTAGDDNATRVSLPLNYTLIDSFTSGEPGIDFNAYAEIGTAYRELNASSEDPFHWELSETETGNAWTIAIKPAIVILSKHHVREQQRRKSMQTILSM